MGKFTMSVDLLSGLKLGTDVKGCRPGCGGIVRFRSGQAFHSLCVGPDDDGDIVVRFESGVYKEYSRYGLAARQWNGRKWVGREIEEYRLDIIEFIRCDRNDPRAAASAGSCRAR